MSYGDYMDGYGTAKNGGLLSPSDPGFDGWLVGRREWEDDRREWEEQGDWAPTTGGAPAAGRVGFFELLFGAPIVVGVTVGLVTLLAGGDWVRWALVSAGGTFAVIVIVALLPLLITLWLIWWVLDLIGIVGPAPS